MTKPNTVWYYCLSRCLGLAAPKQNTTTTRAYTAVKITLSSRNLAAARIAAPRTRVAPVQAERARYPKRPRICPLMGGPTSALSNRQKKLNHSWFQKAHVTAMEPIMTPTAMPCLPGGATLPTHAPCRLITPFRLLVSL